MSVRPSDPSEDGRADMTQIIFHFSLLLGVNMKLNTILQILIFIIGSGVA
jgi:hypothetical protein